MLSKRDSTFIKGLAVLLLLFHHNPLGYNSLTVFRSSARVLVWLFFFVSAYGFSLQLEKGQGRHPIRFVTKRILLLLLPMWLIYPINLAAQIINAPRLILNYFSESWVRLPLDIFSLSHFFGLSGVSGYWYVGMLMVVIVLFPLIDLVVKKTGWLSIPLAYVFILVEPVRLLSCRGGYFDEYLMIVVLGSLFARKKVFEHIPSLPKQLKYVLMVFSIFLILALACVRFELKDLVSESRFFYADPITTMLALAIVLWVFLFRMDNAASSVLEWLGAQSGNIYYIHSIFYNILLFKFPINDRFLSYFLCLGFSLSISFLIESVKKRTDYDSRLRSGIKKLLKET